MTDSGTKQEPPLAQGGTLGLIVLGIGTSIAVVFAFLLCFRVHWQFGTLASILLGSLMGHVLSRFRGLALSAIAVDDGLELTHWCRRRVVPWERITALCLRSELTARSSPRPLTALYFHVKGEQGMVGYSLNRVELSSAVALVRAAAEHAARRDPEVKLGPFVSLSDRSTIQTIVLQSAWMILTGELAAACLRLSGAAVLAVVAFGLWSALVAALLSSELRKRVVFWDGACWRQYQCDAAKGIHPYRDIHPTVVTSESVSRSPPWPLVPMCCRFHAQALAEAATVRLRCDGKLQK